VLIKKVDFFKEIFDPFPHQRRLFDAFFSGNYNRYVLNWHRRCGKDACLFTLAWLNASITPGNFIYLLPKIQQAKSVIWEATNLNGGRWLDDIPKHLLAKEPNNTERKLYFTSGSMLHVTGADSILGSHLGSNLKGIFFSEYQRVNPGIWDYLRPIVLRSNGFACFNFTTLGMNHAYHLMQANIDNPKWYTEKLTVDQSRDNDGNYIFSPEQVQDELDSGMDPEIVRQEYYCDHTVATKGAYFAEQIKQARDEHRIVKNLEIYPNRPVHTSWDLGSRDSNAIWFFQVIGTGQTQQFRYFHYHEANYKDIPYYLQLLHKVKNEYGFSSYGHHFLPHDVSQTEWSSGKTRRVLLLDQGLNITPVPRLKVIERVQIARTNLYKCWFKEDTCKSGILVLEASRAMYNETLKAFSNDEVHDYASHGSAAFQYGHVGWLDCYNKKQMDQQIQYAKYRP
jgi:hypothetical protein